MASYRLHVVTAVVFTMPGPGSARPRDVAIVLHDTTRRLISARHGNKLHYCASCRSQNRSSFLHPHGESSARYILPDREILGIFEAKSSQALVYTYAATQLSQAHQSSIWLPSTSVRMGTGKKEANRKLRQGKTGDGMQNVKVKGENFYR